MYIIGKEEIEAVTQVIEGGHLDRYIDDDNSVTSQFERGLSEKIGISHTIAVSSGTAALICGLAGMNIGPGDEVIIPAFTYIATALAVLAVGAIPVLAEIDETLTIDPLDVENKITSNTRAIIPVHMLGLPCNMSAIVALAKKYNLKVLEDAAQSCGGSYRGQRLGSIGDAGIFSFNHYKILSCGEGGALLTNNNAIYQRAMLHHDGGCIFEKNHPNFQFPIFAGWNFRISEILSAILRVQLNRLDGILAALRIDKHLLTNEISNISPAFSLNPVHDLGGDCATTLCLSFKSGKKAKQFIAQAAQEGMDVWSPLDRIGHVYTDWKPIFDEQKVHHPKSGGFRIVSERFKNLEDVCPKTLSILNQLACISTDLNRSKEDRSKFVTSFKKAIK